MANPHSMLRREPAARWQDALPTGNGTVGAMAYGSIRNETILINHEMLWRRAAPPQVGAPPGRRRTHFRPGKLAPPGRL